MTDTPDTVWVATIDNHTWQAQVERTSIDRGALSVVRIDGNIEIFREPVNVGFDDLLLGPHQEDVLLWVTMAIDAVDHYNAQQEAGQEEDRSNL